MKNFKAFAWLVLAAAVVPTLDAETRCPGNIASVTPRLVANALLVIPVKINHERSFDFMVDTGSQVTVVDPSLALELGLKPRVSVGLLSTASFARASVSVLDSLEAVSQMVEHPLVIVQDLGQIKAADPRIRGVLGENFLAHFDMLIDYGHKMLCLDPSRDMRDKVRGERIPLVSPPLVSPQGGEDELEFAPRLVIAVHLSGVDSRQVLLQIDSGSDGPILYQSRGGNRLALLDRAAQRTGALSAAQRAFAALPAQDLRIGGRTVSQVPFVTPLSVGSNLPARDEDGLLPTALFQRVFISFADHFVVFDPK